MGEVCLYIKSLQFREPHDLDLNVKDVIESKFIEITAKPRKIVISITYRPPNDKPEEFKESLASLLQK